MSEPPVSVLLVCTGNICRSPVAERLLGASLGDAVDVASAGTLALVGRPVAEPMAVLLNRVGVSADRFAGRRLTERLVQGAELVLGLSREHRRAAVDLYPGAVRRSFTLQEFARLLPEVDVETLPAADVAARLRGAVALAAARRRPVQPPESDDIADPYGLSVEHYEQAFEQIQRAVRVMTAVVADPSRAARWSPTDS